jgi:NADPH:quinone reductase-like Zn-dependent oxidoreductase
MRAISPRGWGDADLLEQIEVDRPEPGPTEILVRVRAAGVNPTDWKQRACGGLGLWGKPPILGYDVSGVVQSVGLGVTLFTPGDEVFGMPRFPHQAGAYADYLTAPARQFAPKPQNVDHIQAAALPLAGLTAWQALIDTAHVRPDQRVLIHAAAGGVGHLAIQIAKTKGAHVIGTARTAKHDFVLGLGADEVIDYTKVNFEDQLRDIDAVIDTVGGDYPARSLRTLRPGGIIICLASPLDPPEHVTTQARALDIRIAAPLVEPDRAGLLAIAHLVESGRLRAHIERVLPLAQAADAHRLGETGHVTGKLVLNVAE